MRSIPILLVDDDIELLKILKKIFTMKGFKVYAEADSTKALKMIEQREIAVVVSDIIMPKMDGQELLVACKENKPNVEMIMLTAEGSISGAVQAVKNGAFSYLVKPADIDNLIADVNKAYELYLVKEENFGLKQQLSDGISKKIFVGNDEIINNLRSYAQKIAKTDATALIMGESGTGKEVLANYIHQNSLRNGKPFICVNCAALNENLFESELFGHERGAFTGADKLKKGRFELSAGGTIFLDEIGELSLGIQAKLLRVLQEKSFERVGGVDTIESDFRLIAATNKDLKKEVENLTFREDLYYRINVMPFYIPPLRERRGDIPGLVNNFIEELSRELKKHINAVSPKMMEILVSYEWPGNVRELRNVLERLAVLANDGNLLTSDLPEEICKGSKSKFEISNYEGEGEKYSLREATKSFERRYVLAAMERNQWNISKTATELNIARKNLYKKLNEYELI